MDNHDQTKLSITIETYMTRTLPVAVTLAATSLRHTSMSQLIIDHVFGGND